MPSYYEALPIYKAAMDVAVRVDAVVQRLAKGHKYTLGGRLRETAFDVVVLVARCNRRAERARELPVLCDRIEELKLLVNLGKEVKAFASFKQFAEVMDQVVTLARQAETWRRATVASTSVQSRGDIRLHRGSRDSGVPDFIPCGFPAGVP